MPEYAIVIGINEYANPAWNLSGAVPDALNFTEWLLKDRELPTANIRLLLSPLPAGGTISVDGANGQPVVLHVSGATRPDLVKQLLLKDIARDGWAKDGDILWFYFAGHGCSHVNVRGKDKTEAVLLPQEYAEVEDYNIPIGFSEIVEPLRVSGPKRQFFFLDACRDFVAPDVQVVSPGMYRYMRKPDQKGTHKQYVIYACSPGEKAVEVAENGIFGKLLLSGLKRDPRAVTRRPGLGDYVLRFERLLQFLQKEVSRRLELIPADKPFVQIPQWDVEPDGAPPDFGPYEQKDIQPTELIVRVRPTDALTTAQIRVLYESLPLSPPNEPKGPPLKMVHKFQLLPSFYRVEASADGYEGKPVALEIPDTQVCEVILTRKQVEEENGLESILGPKRGSSTRGFEIDVGTEESIEALVVPKPGRLTVHCRDRLAPIVVTDSGKHQTRNLGSVTLEQAVPGMHQAQVEGPDGAGPPQWIEYPGGEMTVEVIPPQPAIGETQRELWTKRGISHEEYARLSELLGAIAGLSAGSLLAYAAYATYCMSPDGAMHRLQSIGLPSLPPDKRDEAWLTVLIGTKGDRPAGLDIAAFLSASRVIVSTSSTEEEEFQWAGGVTLLPEYPVASYAQIMMPAGGASVGLLLPELVNTRHAISVLKGRSTVLVCTVDDADSVEMQIFSFPLKKEGDDPFSNPLFVSPHELRFVDQAQRYYSGLQDMPSVLIHDIVNQLLWMKITEPFAGCLAGYLMIRLGRGQEYRGLPVPVHSAEWEPQSPMQNMLHFYPEVPDVHVLAALVEPDKADTHFRNAMLAGVPVFTEGFQALLDWNDRAKSQLPKAVLRARRTLLPGEVFSTWMGWQPVLDIKDSVMETPPRAWHRLEDHRKVIEQSAAAVGYLRCTSNDTLPIIGTAFLVGPDQVITTAYVVSSVGAEPLTFCLGDDVSSPPKMERKVVLIEKVDEKIGLALLRLESACDVAALPLSRAIGRPRPQQTIFLAGYPCQDARVEEDRLKLVFESRFGIKRVMPGVVLAAPEDKDKFDYDSSTAGGVGGAPVIDLQTGMLLGVHWASMDDLGYRRGRAVSFWRREAGAPETGYDFLVRVKLLQDDPTTKSEEDK